ncbi:MAG TPA: Rieske 2Fe-2S domain-containing protein [Gemmatimonadaceae bacterium]|nr:Rieske 2Fe-2S domain-containing protein [Gemmatimonadaceae bacterium]
MTGPEPAPPLPQAADGVAGPPPGTEAPPGFISVARLDELPPGALLGVTTPDGRRLCLANVDGTVCALRDECTHQAFPLSAGELRADGTLECAWHGARFDPCTGCVHAGPAVDPVPRYAALVVDGTVWVGPSPI